ncbi:hypothetical protein LTR66_003138 [Elasticomyces elasticus]|nr:hypothetical protein LTR66_003138 [Elasticomyces elasticus]
MTDNAYLLTTTSIPTVTEDDLRAFHATHFPGARPPPAFFADPAYLASVTAREDDGLGYYPDGVKRTITDEQIAMFRHSEIQALLKERRREQERRENNSDDEVEADRLVTRTEEPKGFVVTYGQTKNRKRGQVVSTFDAPGDISTDVQGRNSKKRKPDQDRMDSRSTRERPTHRRLAREQDELKAASVSLDYDDEEVAVPPARSPGLPGNSYESSAKDKGKTTATPRTSGSLKTFHWPLIGRTDISMYD